MATQVRRTSVLRRGVRAQAARLAFLVTVAVLPAAAVAASATIERIKSTGAVRFAYREAAAPFSFKDGDRVRVFATQVELAD